MTTAAIRQRDRSATEGGSPRLAGWLEQRERSFLRTMVGVVSKPGILSMAGGLPEPSLFPAEELRAAVSSVLAEDDRALQYGPASARLKEQVVELAARRGVTATLDQVLITSGAQQGIDVCARAFLEQGSAVLVDEFSYTGIHQTATPFCPVWLEAAVDLRRGGDPTMARELLIERERSGKDAPRLAYLISDGHNPLGLSLAPEWRLEWARLLEQRGVPLVEDDPYGLIWFDQEFDQPIATRLPQTTLYLGSFSKILAPGLRLGYMIVPPELAERVGVVKEASDLETSGLTQRAVARVLDGGTVKQPGSDFDSSWLDSHLDEVRTCYRERRDALLEALERHMPSDAVCTQPRGGMFVWVELEREVDTVELLDRCIQHDGVAFLPGVPFAVPEGRAAERARRSMRLSFSSLPAASFDGAVAAIARQL